MNIRWFWNNTCLLWEELTDDRVCDSQGQDEVEGSGSFAAKLWTYRVLLELIHWTDSASQTLHLFHTEKQGQQQEQIL